MKINWLHDWDLTTRQAIDLQLELANRIDVRSPLTKVELVAGADVSYARFSNVVHAGVVVIRLRDFSVVERQCVTMEVKFPYVPGLLTYREAPPLLAAFEKLQTEPDLVVLDGQGLAHPRRIGLASHVGLWLEKPTVGCAKSLYVGKHRELRTQPGARAVLKDKGETIGMALRTKSRCKPIYVSAGHRVDLPSAVRLVLRACNGYRIPEPTRLAHVFVNEARANALAKPPVTRS